jgi:ligand-binding sensor domain-containing protein
MVGRAYNDTITLEMMGMTDGVSPYTFEIISGALPSGLELNQDTGEISGTPTQRGKYIFTVKVTDSNGKTATAQLQIIIEANDLWTQYSKELGTSALQIWYIYVDSRERKWVGTEQGVHMFEGDGGLGMEWKHYHASDGMKAEDVHAITEDWDGNMWFGHRRSPTEGISVLMKDGSWDLSHNSQLGKYIYCHDMLTDIKGRIWVIHYNGVHMYDPVKRTWTRIISGRHYAAAETTDGTIWLAGEGNHDRNFGKVDGATLEYTQISYNGAMNPTICVNHTKDKVWTRDDSGAGNMVGEYDPATSSWTGRAYNPSGANSMNFDMKGNLWTMDGFTNGKVWKNNEMIKEVGSASTGKEMEEELIVIDRLNTKWMGSVERGSGLWRYTGD